MREFSKREKQWAVGLLAMLVVATAVYALYSSMFGPSPRQARAALAERGWCASDETINRLDGSVIIGNCSCDLERKTFVSPRGHGDFRYVWEFSFTAPFGRWDAGGFMRARAVVMRGSRTWNRCHRRIQAVNVV